MTSKNIILGFVLILAMLVAIILFHTSPSGSLSTTTAAQGNNAQASGSYQSGAVQNSTTILFNNTQYAPYSYLISSPTISAQAQSALSGFKLYRIQLQNGSVEMVLSINGSGQNSTVMVKSGYKLYFIESAFGDDGYGFDSSLGDDGLVLVDPNGYVVA